MCPSPRSSPTLQSVALVQPLDSTLESVFQTNVEFVILNHCSVYNNEGASDVNGYEYLGNQLDRVWIMK